MIVIGYGQRDPSVPAAHVYSAAPLVRGLLAWQRRAKTLWSGYFGGTWSVRGLPSTATVFCGSTANNEREFRFLGETIDGFPGLETYHRQANISFGDRTELNVGFSKKMVVLLCFVIATLYIPRLKGGRLATKTLRLYVTNFVQFFLAFTESPHTPQYVIFSNDHSPHATACLAVAKIFGCKTVYVQHAEVTNRFPPLAFDIAVLRNHRSVRIYESRGESTTKTYVIRREGEVAFTPELALTSPRKPVCVVVHLSVYFDESITESVVSSLKQNPEVSKVLVSFHPAFDLENSRPPWVSEEEVYSRSRPVDHIAIVGNSSVCIDLLAKGIRVFQLFDFSYGPADYYGFVDSEICPHIGMSDLHRPFWDGDFFDGSWLERFSRDHGQSNEERLEQISLLSSRIKPSQ